MVFGFCTEIPFQEPSIYLLSNNWSGVSFINCSCPSFESHPLFINSISPLTVSHNELISGAFVRAFLWPLHHFPITGRRKVKWTWLRLKAISFTLIIRCLLSVCNYHFAKDRSEIGETEVDNGSVDDDGDRDPIKTWWEAETVCHVSV